MASPILTVIFDIFCRRHVETKFTLVTLDYVTKIDDLIRMLKLFAKLFYTAAILK